MRGLMGVSTDTLTSRLPVPLSANCGATQRISLPLRSAQKGASSCPKRARTVPVAKKVPVNVTSVPPATGPERG